MGMAQKAKSMIRITSNEADNSGKHAELIDTKLQNAVQITEDAETYLEPMSLFADKKWTKTDLADVVS